MDSLLCRIILQHWTLSCINLDSMLAFKQCLTLVDAKSFSNHDCHAKLSIIGWRCVYLFTPSWCRRVLKISIFTIK
uniref:Uncharacterized protein n=1 Tax=Rhizophora mucronata TaxID=61149 RepID=A0A2P2NYZ9_RHIMU